MWPRGLATYVRMWPRGLAYHTPNSIYVRTYVTEGPSRLRKLRVGGLAAYAGSQPPQRGLRSRLSSLWASGGGAAGAAAGRARCPRAATGAAPPGRASRAGPSPPKHNTERHTQTDTDRHRNTHRDTHRDTHRHVYSHRETRESMLFCVPLQG